MDAIDRKIMGILQRDASIRNVQLADMVGLAPSSCLRRVAALKANGTIRRIVALPDPEKVGRGIKAIVTIKLKEHDEASIQHVVRSFSQHESVSQAYTISGEHDVIVVMSASSMADFQKSIRAIILTATNVEQYFCHFVLEEHKFEPSL